MMNRNLITSFAIAAAAALPLTAGAVISPVEERPLTSCDSAVRSELGNVRVTDTFHRRAADGSHEIYLNLEKFENGRMVPQRVTCETGPSGRRVLDLQAESGRWVEAPRG
jgi:hypothetical protein